MTTMRVMIGMVLMTVLGVAAMMTPAPAAAAPLGTTRVVPSTAACQQRGMDANVRCAVALVDRFLSAKGANDVVRETVLVGPNTVGVWFNSDLSVRCGFSSLPPAFSTSLHYCDGITFVDLNLSFDRKIMTSRTLAVIVLTHESGHGLQERAGLDPVGASLSGTKVQLYQLESSADCWAGVGTKWYVTQGLLPASAKTEGVKLMRSIGVEDDGHGHGSASNRQRAFEAGYDQGSTACNALVGHNGVF
ncbi:MAG: hypothetical protein WAS27_00540 [Candidatus Saccharimonadales bacterium]